jgi:hypothetical protein
LAARQILERRGDTAPDVHGAGVDRLRRAEPRQRGAIRADEEDRLDQVAARLFDRERGQLAVVERALGHHPVAGERELLGNLLEREFGHGRIAAALLRQQPVRVVDGAFAAFDRDIHVSLPPRGASAAAR